jgi:hypothetical protein
MNINEIYKLVSYMVDKYQGAYLAPDDFNMAINAAQRQYLNFLTGETAEFNQGSRRPSGGFSNDVTTGGSLSNFLKEGTLTITTQLAAQPTDFYKISAMRTTDDDYAIKRVGADKIYAYVNNPIDTPTLTEPIYTEIGSNFKFWPSTLATAKIVYFKKPADAKWAYTGDLVYDSGTSVQLEWPENDHMDIVYRTLGIIGINLKDGDLIRVSQTVKNDGQ